MNRRFAVLGLVLAMCGTGSTVAGQSETRISELAPDAVRVDTALMAALLRMRQDSWRRDNPGQQLGPLVVTVESVGPKFTRIHLTQNGVTLGTFESTAFTVTTGAEGTTITSSNRVRTRNGSRMSWTDDGFEVRTSPAGEIFTSYRSGPVPPVR